MKTPYRISLAVFLAAGLAASQSAAADTVADFYKGRSVTLMVSAGAGGGYDAYARTLGRHIARHIPGNPSIVVQNRPGAGGLVAANYMYNVAVKDGSVFGAIHRNMPTDPLIGNKGNKIKYKTREFNWIGSLNDEVSICAHWKGAPISSLKEAMEKEIILGAESNTDIEQFPVVLNNMIGTRFKIITGYRSGTDVNLAMQRGEVQGRCGWSWSSFKSQYLQRWKNGEIFPFAQIAFAKHPDLPRIPLVMDFVKSANDKKALKIIFARQAFGRPYFAPPGVPKDRVAALRTAFTATTRDPAFVKDIDRQKLELNPMSGEQLQALIEELFDSPKEILDLAQQALLPRVALAKAKLVPLKKDKGKVAEVQKGGRSIVFMVGGKKVKAKISGSRTRIKIGGKDAKRGALKAGMTCQVSYPAPGQEATRVECDG
jgi:tripartite-type tricarboxylate transporter receptor subunit TctC